MKEPREWGGIMHKLLCILRERGRLVERAIKTVLPPKTEETAVQTIAKAYPTISKALPPTTTPLVGQSTCVRMCVRKCVCIGMCVCMLAACA